MSSKEVLAYIDFWTRKKRDLEGEIARKRRSLELVNEKLSDPEFHLKKELGRGAVKVSKILGHETVQKPKTILKKNSGVSVPSKEEIEVAAPPAPAREEKQKTGFGFFKG